MTSLDSGGRRSAPQRAPAGSEARPDPTGTAPEARFLPGAVVAGRYRIVGIVGRGGMGEVYRADDLRLGQPVALKFLPEALARDEAWLSRFHDEVRIARQVSHPNVCRVHDIGDVEGQHYFTMEYVDGEDLSSLLRRIGRLPRDKAVELARQLCAGLAAAHERGVLHRDLKPANVMIDGRGQVRLTDFGIAGLEGELRRGDARAGTPAYMAPEQLSRGEATVRSDIYSLGLVLYEMFTGKPAFEGRTHDDLRRLHEETQPASPSRVLEDIDPAVERVILRCLEKDPRNRPASALAVAAALPGGDPLAAALAAGETPSPEVVAAAGEEGRLRPAIAWAAFSGLAVGVFLAAFLSGRARLVERVPLEKPPEALAERAREVLETTRRVRGPETATALGFSQDEDVLRWLEKRDRSSARWGPLSSGRLGAVSFWYRESPRPLVPWRSFTSTVGLADPPLESVSGNARVVLDERGRLIELVVVPPQVPDRGGASPEPDWAPLFRSAGLDAASFERDEPRWLPPVWTDARAAWKGRLPELPDVEVRVEAGAFRGAPDYFAIVGPWTRAERMQPFVKSRAETIAQNFAVTVLVLGLLGAAFLARRNLRSGRGDRRGAGRMGLYVLAAYLLRWALQARHHASLQDEFESLLRGAGIALFVGAFVWLLYLALEPAVRRRWPSTIISWSRLIALRLRDPLVGRDVLLGAGFGVAVLLLQHLQEWTAITAGYPPPRPWSSFLDALVSGRAAAGQAIAVHVGAALGPLLLLLLLVSLRSLVRIGWLAMVLGLVLFVPLAGLGENPAIDVPFALVVIGLQILLLMRLGLLSLIVANMSANLLANLPVTLGGAVWWSGTSWAVIALVLGIGALGFRTALGRERRSGEH